MNFSKHVTTTISQPFLLFAGFLVAYIIIWGISPAILLSSVYPDSAENIALSHVLSWSYSKHPPLGMFMMAVALKVFGHIELATYLASCLCLMVSLFYVYKISTFFLATEEAISATVISSLSYYFLANFVLQYNQNTIMLPFWTAVIFYSLKVNTSNNIKDWLILSIISALAVLAKYESLLILAIAFFYLIKQINKKNIAYFLLAMSLFMLILSPHLQALFNEQFKSLSYVSGYIQSESAYSMLLNAGIAFITQVANLILCGLFLMISINRKSIQLADQNHQQPAGALYYFAFSPLIIFAFIACYMNVRAEWGFSLLILWLPALFKLFNLKTLNLKKLISAVIIIHTLIFLSSTLLYFLDDKTHRHNNPSYELSAKTKQFMIRHNIKTVDYVGGDEIEAYYLTAYLGPKVQLLKYNDLAYSPWIDKKTFQQAIFLFIDNHCSNNNKLKYQNLGYKLIASDCLSMNIANKRTPHTIKYMVHLAKNT